MKKEFPRVLITSVDVWNDKSGSDTFTNLLSGYDVNKVANIYIRNGKPTSTICNKYLLISENAVIKSVFKKDVKTGIRVQKENGLEFEDYIEEEYQKEQRRYSFFSKYRLWIFIYLREILWKIGHWKSQELDEFVDDFNPEVLFFPIEGYIHFNKINEYLIEKTNAKAIGIIWDDNFTYKVNPQNLGFLIHRFFLKKSVKRLITKCDKVFAISPQMQRECKETFDVDAEVLTKGARIREKPKESNQTRNNKPLRIVYTGKLNYGRLETVRLVAEVLNEINDNQIKIELYIYSGTVLDDKGKACLNKKGTWFKGHVTQDKIPDIQKNADVLLVAEALKGKHKYDARLSFSTKIVDYLAQGKCILAIGPENIAPIGYLRENDAALVASNEHELVSRLQLLMKNEDNICLYGEKAYNLAIKKHDIENIQKKLYQSFQTELTMKNELL